MGGINQALASDKILRINDNELIGMTQNFDWTPELGAQDIYELGSQKKVDTAYDLRVSGSFEQNGVGNTAGILARMIPTRVASTDAFTGYKYASGGGSGKNGYTLTEADLVESRFDLIQHERPDGKDFSRSLLFPRANLATISGSCRADGFASETYAFRCSEVQGFIDPYHDIRSIYATRTSGTAALMSDTAMTGYTLAFVYINDRRFRNGTTTDATKFTMSTGGVLTIATTEGFVIPVDADIHAVVYKTTPATTFPVITSGMRGTTANYVRGQQINIYIAPVVVGTPTDPEKFLRVQSLDWSVDMGLQELMEIQRNDKGSATYIQVPTLPFNISCNATVYETDWKEWKALINKTFTVDVYDSTLEFAPSVLKTQFAIVVEYWTKNNPAAKLQTWQFLDMAPNGRGTRVGVRGRGEVSWSFSGTSFQLQGFNV
jgi:hypothetical protein